MPNFSYKASTKEGVLVDGLFDAPDEKYVVERLKKTGLIPIEISPVNEGIKRKFLSGISTRDVLSFTTQLSTMLNSGLPLDRSLNILSNITDNRKLQEVISSILKSIREGSSFSEALNRHPQVFSRLYVNMVKAGEVGGVLEIVLEKLVDFLESTRELKDSIFSAMIYPTILLTTGTISIIVLLTYVLPKFTSIFSELGTTLPLSTTILINISTKLQDFWWIVMLSFVMLVIFLNRFVKTEDGRRIWDKTKIRLLGNLIKELETARFSRTLGTLLKSGVPLIQALNNVKDITNNTIVSATIEQLAKDVKEGKTISDSLNNTKLFPKLALSMIKVGEESGQLEDMLLKVATNYEKSLKQSIKRFVGFIEPVMILTMGLIIGFIVLSMLAAIFSITDLPF
ncbi:MAG: type II secretion system F family protein [Thermodesulfovibrionales bacterium]|nr:type II secretion system F family protein [Thermodesulfovibrionales bacterium]